MLTHEQFFSLKNLNRIERLAFAPCRSVFDPWFPSGRDGDLQEATCKLFSEWDAAEQAELKDHPESSQPRILVSAHHTSRSCADQLDHPDLRRLGQIFIYGGEQGKFDRSSHLRAPLLIGTGVRIRLSAKVMGPALLGDAVAIGSSCVVARSIVFPRAKIDDGAKIKDSLIGFGAYIGPDAKLLNKLDLGFREIVVPDLRDERHPPFETKRARLGAVIGDGCVIGAGAILYPGTVLLPGCRIAPGQVVPSGVYDQAALERGRGGVW